MLPTNVKSNRDIKSSTKQTDTKLRADIDDRSFGQIPQLEPSENDPHDDLIVWSEHNDTKDAKDARNTATHNGNHKNRGSFRRRSNVTQYVTEIQQHISQAAEPNAVVTRDEHEAWRYCNDLESKQPEATPSKTRDTARHEIAKENASRMKMRRVPTPFKQAMNNTASATIALRDRAQL